MAKLNRNRAGRGKGWVVDAFRRESGRYPLGESICKLPEPARSRAVEAVFDLLYHAAVGVQEGSRSFRFPDAKPLGGDLYEASRKGDLRIIATTVPQGARLILLDVIQKKRPDIPPDVMSHLRRLQQEALRARQRQEQR
jgi:hypothetical protein